MSDSRGNVLRDFPVATLLAVIITVAGAVAVLGDDLSWKEYVESIAVLVGLLGVGRGLAARKPN